MNADPIIGVATRDIAADEVIAIINPLTGEVRLSGAVRPMDNNSAMLLGGMFFGPELEPQ